MSKNNDNPGTVLKNIVLDILSKLNVSEERLDIITARHFKKLLGSDNKNTVTYTISNFTRSMSKPWLSWKRFFTLLDIIKAYKVTITIKVSLDEEDKNTVTGRAVINFNRKENSGTRTENQEK